MVQLSQLTATGADELFLASQQVARASWLAFDVILPPVSLLDVQKELISVLTPGGVHVTQGWPIKAMHCLHNPTFH